MDAFGYDVGQPTLPPEFISAWQAQARSDVNGAVELVRRSIEGANDSALKLGVEDGNLTTLIGFGLVVRFWRWERQHIRVHIDAGLPSSAEMLARMVKLGRGQELANYVAWGLVKSAEVFHDSFLWAAEDSDRHLDFAIEGREDDAFLDAITQFLLDHILKVTS